MGIGDQFLRMNIPYITAGYGMSFPWGTFLPPGGKVVAFVRSSGYQDGDDPNVMDNLVTSIGTACLRAKAGRQDTIVVLPGHSEAITDATLFTNLAHDTRIIGFGQGSSMPKIQWTNTAAQLAIAKNNVYISGMRFSMDGANGITKAILVTGSDCVFTGNDFVFASGAAAKAAIALEVGAGADRFQFIGNYVRGTDTHNVTDGIKIVSAVADIKILGNIMTASATAANGLVHFTAAATNSCVGGNQISNTMTASSACLVYDAVVATGIACDNYFAVLNNGAAASQGITMGAGCLVKAFQNFCCDEPQKSGILSPAAAT